VTRALFAASSSSASPTSSRSVRSGSSAPVLRRSQQGQPRHAGTAQDDRGSRAPRRARARGLRGPLAVLRNPRAVARPPRLEEDRHVGSPHRRRVAGHGARLWRST